MYLTDLIEPLHARLVGVDAEFNSLSTDSRQLRNGELFVALRGDHFDGHDFARAAVDRGACAMVVEREIETANVPQLIVADSTKALGIIGALKRRHFDGQLVAVTGSSGKTSVKGLLREIFAVAGTVVATPGNFNNHIGVPLSLMSLTTQEYAVIEIGTNHPGEIAALVNLARPNIALVNNVSAAHIAGFGSLAAIAREKGDIYSTLTERDTAIINLDDQFAPQFIEATKHCRQIGFSLTDVAQPFPSMGARNIKFDAAGRASFELHYASDKVPVNLLLPGLHNVANALAAAACAMAAGVTDRLWEMAKTWELPEGDVITALPEYVVEDELVSEAVPLLTEIEERLHQETARVLAGAAARYRTEWLPQADWVELDGVGHCPQLDVPAVTAELILGLTA